MKTIKLAVAVTMLSLSANAAAMPSQVPDRYYDRMWNWVAVIMGQHRPCVGPEDAWC